MPLFISYGVILSAYNENDTSVSGYIGSNRRLARKYDDLMKNSDELFQKRLEFIVSEAVEDKTDPHASVPVYLSKYINIKSMLEIDAAFIRFSIYKLALKIIDKGILSDDYNTNISTNLFFHTLNGGYIATQLSELFNINMMYLDHLGPIENVHRKHFEKNIQDNKNYIIISDVICLGGEVGRAKTIIEYCGGLVHGVVCLVDVKTIDIELFENKVSLYSITKERNTVNYTIKTDLCDICERKKEKEKAK